MSVRAKFRCTNTVTATDESYKSVCLQAVYDPDPNSENYAWSQATPSGVLNMNITNPAAFNQFEMGVEYYINIEPVNTCAEAPVAE